jgi:hypothetical protein
VALVSLFQVMVSDALQMLNFPVAHGSANKSPWMAHLSHPRACGGHTVKTNLRRNRNVLCERKRVSRCRRQRLSDAISEAEATTVDPNGWSSLPLAPLKQRRQTLCRFVCTCSTGCNHNHNYACWNCLLILFCPS